MSVLPYDNKLIMFSKCRLFLSNNPEQCLHKEICVLADGKIKWFSDKKGFGFIEQEEGKDIFVHYTSINMSGFKTLAEGDRVIFDVEDSERGPVARNVQKTQ